MARRSPVAHDERVATDDPALDDFGRLFQRFLAKLLLGAGGGGAVGGWSVTVGDG